MTIYNRAFEKLSPSHLGHVDLVFADPPDNIGMKYQGYDDRIPDQLYQTYMHEWLRLARLACPDGPIFWCFNERWTGVVEHALTALEIPLIQRCYWRFTFGQNQKRRYTPSLRPIYWLGNPVMYPDRVKVPSARQAIYHDKRAKAGGKVPDNCWDFSRVCGTFKERREWHPCQIPEALVERVVLGHSQPGQIVLDPFMGSGTTAIVCARNDRKCVGAEVSRVYYRKIQDELSKLSGERPVKGRRTRCSAC